MKSMGLFFKQLTTGKKVLLATTPIISIIFSMKLLLLGLWLLIIIDLLTGISKSLYQKNIKCNPLKKNFWLSIKSYLLRKTWRKTYEYAFGIIAIIILENLILGETTIKIIDRPFTITELSIIVPACVEVWSIYENLEAVSGRNSLKTFKSFIMRYRKPNKVDIDVVKNN